MTSIYFLLTCNSESSTLSKERSSNHENGANALIHESSPYLLQHAYNPVDWKAWNQETLDQAKRENKPLLISIGYSACHWCHVMEEESFEDSAVAQLMNENFICIKVDREERPDLDHLYMDAVQLMSGRGGWPLNCFALPDGRPFYGGTYFPKEQWKSVLTQLKELYQSDEAKVIEYAEKLSNGLKNGELFDEDDFYRGQFNLDKLQESLSKWRSQFDTKMGGNNYAPKFPMPNNYEFLLHYLHFFSDQELKAHFDNTLHKMAMGGIYDQIGGGFARYSTDMEWKVPHFEKMLYDNAQLISLYAKANRAEANPLYASVVESSLAFLNRELKDENGAFYSALDADSEGEEGKYYVWSEEELNKLLSDDEMQLARHTYDLSKQALWEGNYILMKKGSDDTAAEALNLSLTEYREKVRALKAKMLDHRAERVRPGLDDKVITSWNAMTANALVEAYLSLNEEAYLRQAIIVGEFIISKQMDKDGKLFHTFKNGKSSINGFLDDYSFSIEAFLALYQATFDEKWIVKAQQLLNYSLKHFKDPNSPYFFYNSSLDPKLISRKIEKDDNVIPSSNSSICKAIFELGKITAQKELIELSDSMLRASYPQIEKYLPYSSNWSIQLLKRSKPFFETAIVGKDAMDLKNKLTRHYLPNQVILGSTNENSQLDLLEHKWQKNATYIYVCEDFSCQAPTTDLNQALAQLGR